MFSTSSLVVVRCGQVVFPLGFSWPKKGAPTLSGDGPRGPAGALRPQYLVRPAWANVPQQRGIGGHDVAEKVSREVGVTQMLMSFILIYIDLY